MREMLQAYAGTKSEFVGEFKRVSISKIKRDVVILMENIKDADGKYVADHNWMTVSVKSLNSGIGKIVAGKVIRIMGEVRKYRKASGEISVGIDNVEILATV